MRILIIGNGGREHALAWKLAQSPRVAKLFCAPGNAGIAGVAESVPIKANDLKGLLTFAKDQQIDLTVVGPEAPLTDGIVDRFEAAGLRIYGPSLMAARLEGSKVFAKKFMERHGIPTAPFAVFGDPAEAKAHIRKLGAPLVVKADGLAAGKGVVVAGTVEEAVSAVDWIMEARAFGDAGRQVVIESCLQGEEASFMAFTDGTTVLPMVSAQDHKRVGDGDTGPNTGGMGAYSPAPVVTEDLVRRVMDTVMLPAVRGMAAEGTLYRGILYAGLMIASEEVRVLEFNCRFGDPETQVVLPRLETDLLEIIEATLAGRLSEVPVRWTPRPSVCVVLASGGYPEKPETGKEITGLDKAGREADVTVFHAGTAFRDGKRIVTDGGRVLGVTALGADLPDALKKAYSIVGAIHFDGMHYRKDIGARALNRGGKR